MKIILLQDVAKIGRRNSIVEVPDGYAQNQLIPKKMALPATPENLKRINKLHADVAAGAAKALDQFSATVAALRQTPLEISAEANEQAHLFKAISDKDVVLAASKRGIVIEVKQVVFSEPIKSLGTHEITLKQGTHEARVEIVITSKK